MEEKVLRFCLPKIHSLLGERVGGSYNKTPIRFSRIFIFHATVDPTTVPFNCLISNLALSGKISLNLVITGSYYSLHDSMYQLISTFLQ